MRFRHGDKKTDSREGVEHLHLARLEENIPSSRLLTAYSSKKNFGVSPMAGLLINGCFTARVISAWGLEDCSSKTDFYVIITLDNHSLGRTKLASGSAPRWDFETTCFLHGYLQPSTVFYFTLFERHRLRTDSVVGSYRILANDLLNYGTLSEQFPLQGAGEESSLLMELVYDKNTPGEEEMKNEIPKYNVTNMEDTPTPVSPRSGVRSPVSSPRAGLLVSPVSPRARIKNQTDVQGLADARLTQQLLSGRLGGATNTNSGRMSGFLLSPRRNKAKPEEKLY